jgi:hypothetical protein
MSMRLSFFNLWYTTLPGKIMHARSLGILVPVAAIMTCSALLGCLIPGIFTVDQKGYMNISKRNVTSQEINGKLRISCEVVNTGDPGWVVVEGHVTQGDTTLKDTKRIHLDRGQVEPVSFEFDVGVGVFSYGFKFPTKEPDPIN